MPAAQNNTLRATLSAPQMEEASKMMNPYVISPNVVKIQLDADLTNQFPHLNSSLHWRPLTTNLESCETPPYLYFRISLKPRAGSPTFAGFATGAPSMLTRDKDVKKRAFFLRHWVRNAPPSENSAAPLTKLPHMAIAARDERLLVRVDIDRKFVSEDTFKSIPFATWMFQVVQLDAVIHGLPGIRFSFAIERTVTIDERELVVASGLSLPSKGPRVKQTPAQLMQSRPSIPQHPTQKSPTPRPARPLLGQPMHHAPMQQNVAPRPAYASCAPRPPAAAFQPNPYAYTSSRPVPLQMRPNVAPRPAHMASHIQKVPPRNSARPINPISTVAVQPVENLRPVMHPYLRLWEDRDLDDPYEPIFITEDHKYEEKARKLWVVEQEEDHAKRFECQHLFGIPTSDYPSYYFGGQTITDASGEPDMEIIVQRKSRPRPVTSEVTSDSEDDVKMDDVSKYNASVIAASDFNAQLKNERGALQKWLEEDVSREEQEIEGQEDEDDGDGDSSE